MGKRKGATFRLLRADPYDGIATRETLVSREVSAHLTPMRFRYRLPDVAEAVVAGSEPPASGTPLVACYQ